VNTESVEIRCINPACSGVLGHCTPGWFVPAGSRVVITSRVVLVCPICSRQRTWRPALDAAEKGK
jgi:hypothetical protein